MSLPPLPGSQPNSVVFVGGVPGQLAVNASATLYAQADYPLSANPVNSTLVTYSMSCGSNACGTLSGSNQVGAIVYTAPSAVPTGGTVTITATSVADTKVSASTVITITPPVPITVSFFSSVPASLTQGASTQISAQIANDTSANPQVKWSVTCSSTVCGSLSATETYNEQLTTYTAPSAVPSGGSVTITATSVTDSTKSVVANIAILPTAAQLADGAYVFQITGLSSLGNTFTTGAFIASGGAIVSGEQDTENSSSYLSQFSPIVGGSYSPMPDGNLQISLDVPSLGGTPEVFTGTMTSGAHGFVAGVQGIVGTGTLEQQASIATPSGSYALLVDGGSFYEQGPLTAGILNIDGPGTISGKGSILDIETDGQPGSMQLSPSSVSPPDRYGRVLIQLNPVPIEPLTATYVVAYVVDGTHMRLILSGDAANSYVTFFDLGGLALGQGTNAGSFSIASVAGSSYVFAAEGRDQRSALQLAGTCTLNADGSVTGLLNWNDLSGGAGQSPIPFKGTYTVDATGRLTLSNLTDGANFNYSLHLYLDGKGSGLVLSNDTNDQFTGQAFERQSAAFSAASLSGRYGVSAGLYAMPRNGAYSTPTLTGWLTSTPNGSADTLSGYADLGNGAYDFALTGTLSADSSGVFQGQLAGLVGVLKSNTTSPSTQPNNVTLFMIDNTQGILMETDNTQLMLGRLQLAQ